MRTADDLATHGKKEHRLPQASSGDAPLFIKEVLPLNVPVRPVPIVLLHGATFGSAMFDIPVKGYSLQAFLAKKGWRSFALDVRGYGRSRLASALEMAEGSNPPHVRVADALEDLATSVRYALEQAGCESLHIISFSWGTVAAGMFAAEHPSLVESLVLYAPIYAEINKPWIKRIADPNDPSRVNPALGSFRLLNLEDIRARWDADIPAGADIGTYREERVLQAIYEKLIELDPDAGRQPTFRVPTGALLDLFEIFNGRPLYDPSGVALSTLVVRGQDDTTSTESDALALFRKLGTTYKRYVAISPGSHFLCAERNASQLFEEIELFLCQSSGSGARGSCADAGSPGA